MVKASVEASVGSNSRASDRVQRKQMQTLSTNTPAQAALAGQQPMLELSHFNPKARLVVSERPLPTRKLKLSTLVQVESAVAPVSPEAKRTICLAER